jgi:hypothetical protein
MRRSPAQPHNTNRNVNVTKLEPTLRTEQLANPFRPGNGVAPPYLAGRDPLLVAFDEFLSERPLHANWAITGLRGTGKTVLLGEFAARAEHAGWLTLQRELGERHRDDERLAEAIVEDADALLRRANMMAGVEQAIEQGLRFLRPRRLTVGEVGYEPSYEQGTSSPAGRMREALAGLDAVFNAGRPRGALLLYDEAHLLADDRARERYPLSGLLAALGAAQRVEPRVRVVLSGLPTLSLNLKRARTYAERMFRHVVVGNLSRDDSWDALGIPLAASGQRFALSVIGEIVEQTGGYPYFLQFFGAYVWRSVAAEEVSLADYRALEPALLHELDLAFFDDRFEVASPTEQRILEAMAREAGAARLTQIREHLPGQAGMDLLVRRLVERGLIYRATRGAYDFALPLFGDYLRRRAKLTELTRSVRTDTASTSGGPR